MAADFSDLVLCGYQGWFAAGEDNTLRRWSHWSRSGPPGPDDTSFELYPDLREYPASTLVATRYGNLRNGQPAMLFGSERDGVVDLHFRWMREYGLDGVSLQRFVVGLRDGRRRGWRNRVAGLVRAAAEAHGRSFCVMYDISGASWPVDGQDLVEEITRDLQGTLVDELGLIGSSAHAREGGLPVVAIWGFGFQDRPADPDEALALIRRLKDDGFYVVGGVPYRWRDQGADSLPGWLSVYEAFDMLIPWGVGRYKSVQQVTHAHRRIWEADRDRCAQLGIKLQRVIYPGFAWSNLKNQAGSNPNARSRHDLQSEPAPRNAVPREGGKFFWAQARQAAELGAGAFIAMFDEYDEATAIAKAAESDAMTPADEYFMALDEDRIDMSSDFYLRLAADATEMIKGAAALSAEPPTPYRVPAATPQWAHDEAPVVARRALRGLVGRVDLGEWSRHVRELRDGSSTQRLCNDITESPAFQARRAENDDPELALQLYHGLLGRAPSDKELQRTVRRLRAGKLAAHARQLLRSDEFRGRFLDPD